MTSTLLYAGLDLGTSGARVVVIDEKGVVNGSGRSLLNEHGSNHRDPHLWWKAAKAAIQQLQGRVSLTGLQAIAVDATSGTLLATDSNGIPLADALMYNDAIDDPAVLQPVAQHAPANSAVHGASSGLARAIALQQTTHSKRILHQADWIAGCLSGNFTTSDESNALKTGYDPIARRWPDWLAQTGVNVEQLPSVLPAATVSGTLSNDAAKTLGLPATVRIVTGVTDGCASFLATGAGSAGDCVTALGSTITMKMLCEQPVFSAQYGVYSNRIGDRWLAGGASNSGGAVLAQYFDTEQLETLSRRIDTSSRAGLNYYPLTKPGERFPHNDANRPPQLEPRPADDALFLQGLFEGMAAIEQLGYRRLTELGAPRAGSMRTVGGGAANAQWTQIRQQAMPDVPFVASDSVEAAYGTAKLAMLACKA